MKMLWKMLPSPNCILYDQERVKELPKRNIYISKNPNLRRLVSPCSMVDSSTLFRVTSRSDTMVREGAEGER